MGDAAPVSQLDASAAPGSYGAARKRLTEFLIRATLIESYHRFARHGKPYPFVTRAALRPGASAPSTEHPFQRGALVLLLDGPVPRALHKHIRFRRANEVNPTNLMTLAPDLERIPFDERDCACDSPNLEAVLDRLIDLDFSLLFQRESGAACPQLTHMHVKIERLSDNAVRELAVALGYVKRRLFEQGESHVEALERKYHEYYGFSPNASGRKSAAAMAAQLLRRTAERATVFSTSQEDCRLTLLDESDCVVHYVLVPLVPTILATASGPDAERYVVDTLKAGGESLRRVVVLRARFRRTAAASAWSADGPDRDPGDLEADWLELVDEAVMPLPGPNGRNAPPVPITWAGGSQAPE